MELIFTLVVLFTLGLVLGSFLSCITYRIPRGKTFLSGRSFCPTCKHTLSWYDNIPILSYLQLRGKCRYCHTKISPRYPLMELATALIFTFFTFLYFNCEGGNYYFCSWQNNLGLLALPFLLFNVLIILSIFVIDLERQIIPDEIVFLGFIVSFVVFFITSGELFPRLFSAFLMAAFLLVLHLATRGRGMGLGDVKFAIYAGFLMLPFVAGFWMFLAFMLGSIIGVALIVLGKAKFGAKIPFGPFLAASLIITLIIGNPFGFLTFFF